MRSLFFLFLLLLSPILYANQLIIEPDMGRAPILNFINQTNYNLNLVMYGLTDKALLNALIQQKKAGKTVRILLERNPYKSEGQNQLAIDAFNTNHISWQGDIPGMKLIHQKTLIVDDKQALVMTFNFTYPTFKNQRNFALLIDDATQVKQINTMFNADWNRTPGKLQSNTLLYSPNNSRSSIANLINQATQSIKIYAQNMSDYKVNGLLAKAARKGVVVELLTSEKMRDKQYQFLTRAGLHIRMSKDLVIHAKVIIFDDKSAVIGSINLTRPSLDDNRELAVVVTEKSIVDQLNHTFMHDWQH